MVSQTASWVLDYAEAGTAEKTIIRNDPMGVFEMESFATGTKEMKNKFVEVTEAGTITIIEGGDTAVPARAISGPAWMATPSSSMAPASALMQWRWGRRS